MKKKTPRLTKPKKITIVLSPQRAAVIMALASHDRAKLTTVVQEIVDNWIDTAIKMSSHEH